MKKGEAKDFLPLIQALADGKTIQHKPPNADDSYFKDCGWSSFSFDAEPERYRIKPEPRECYVAFNDDGSVINARTAECETHPSMYKYVKMREVIE